jgi:hypothetical protein
MSDTSTPWFYGNTAQEEIDLINKQYADAAKVISGTDYTGQAAAANARAKANLDRYIRESQAYTQNRKNAVLDAYRGLGQQTVGAGRDISGRGLEISDEINRLYETLANTNAATMQRANAASAQNMAGGLVPLSGEAATMAQTLPSYGSNLANYLTAQTGISGASMYDLAAAQQQQGMSYAQNYVDQVNSALAKMRFDAEREAAARMAAAGNASRSKLAELELQRLAAVGELELDAARQARKSRGLAQSMYQYAPQISKTFKDDEVKKLLLQLGMGKEEMEAGDPTRANLNTYLASYLRQAAVENPYLYQSIVMDSAGSPRELLAQQIFQNYNQGS